MVAALAAERGERHPRHHRRLPPRDRRRLRGLARRGGRARRRRLPPHPPRDDRRRVADRDLPRQRRADRGAGAALRHVLPRPPARRSPATSRVACEGTQFVLDHCGVPDIAGGVWEPWHRGIVGAGGAAERRRQALRGLRLREAGRGRPRDGAAVGRGGDRRLRAGALPVGERLAGVQRPGRRPADLDRGVPGDPRRLFRRTSRRRWRTGRRSGSTRCGCRRSGRPAGKGGPRTPSWPSANSPPRIFEDRRWGGCDSGRPPRIRHSRLRGRSCTFRANEGAPPMPIRPILTALALLLAPPLHAQPAPDAAPQPQAEAPRGRAPPRAPGSPATRSTSATAPSPSPRRPAP